MGIYSDHLSREVRLERMRPAEVDQARQEQPAIYVPFGSIEWHGYHNPVGLDAIKAHEQLVGLAVRSGGVVYPPVFFGSGGGHLEWPHTYMVSSDPMVSVVSQLLMGFEKKGYRKTILLSGHYPNRSEYLDQAISAYTAKAGKMAVLALVENQIPHGLGDHAAKYETSFMLYLHPETVDGEALRGDGKPVAAETSFLSEQVINWMGEEYRQHPCYGLVGIDPRQTANRQLGQEMTNNLLDFLQSWLERS